MSNFQVDRNNPTPDIDCTVTLVRRIHPKRNVHSGDWQVCDVEIIDVTEGVPFSKWVTVTGNMVAMENEEYCGKYRIVGKLTETNYGLQYEVTYSQELYTFNGVEDQKKFLAQILTERQLESIVKVFPDNPLKPLQEHDIEGLMTVGGIGEKTAYKLIQRYEACKDYGKAYIELARYGLTKRMIDKLVDSYGSPDIAVEKVKTNPYVLIEEVDGIGFIKADEIALAGGYDPYGYKRCKAFVIDYFRELSADGNSFTTYDDLLDALDNELGSDFPDESVSKAMRELEETGVIWAKEQGDSLLVALKKYYNLERSVARHLKRLLEAPSNLQVDEESAMIRIREQEAKQGWEFTEQQLEGVFTTMNNNVTIIRGYGGCVDCDTEYFNGKEWKRIADYQEGELVLQYNEDGSATLVKPKQYVKYEEDTMYHFQTKYGVDQCLSWEHRVVYRTSKGNLHIKPFHDVMKNHNNCKSGFTGKFYTTFNYSGTGIDKTDDEIRLQIAYMADGYFSGDITNRCVMRLKKKRKQQRLEMLLQKMNIEYKCRKEESGFNVYTFYAPNSEKDFEAYWYNCNQHQFEVICDEVLHWDGSQSNKNSFYTTSKKTADLIQFAFATIGKRCNMMIDDRIGETISGKEGYTHKSVGYYFTPTDRNMVGIGGFHEGQTKTPIVPVPTKDGYKYCFEVDSSMLVLRRNGKIFITGNTGKTSCVTGLLACAPEDYSFKQCALSGKASVNLTDVTGAEGYTIHRLLDVDPRTGGFLHNEENPLEGDLFILDEGSMVDIPLAESLLQAIPTGAKLIILGDTNQLESIGVGNFMLDMIDSGMIPVITFDKVHRQGAKSAIIGESIKVAQGVAPVPYGWEGEMVLGELKDLKYIGFNVDKGVPKPTRDLIVKEYKKFYQECKDISQIAVLLPTKERGSGCYGVNIEIQDYVLPPLAKRGIGMTIGEGTDYPYTIYVGDKVINLKNAKPKYDGSGDVSERIYNGNMGEVVKVGYDYLLIDFYGIGEVFVKGKQLQQIALGYAITIHKSQGSTIPYTIFGLDYSHFSMLTRQLVYTGETRAKKKSTVIFETNALIRAIKTNNIVQKDTFLYYFLTDVLPM